MNEISRQSIQSLQRKTMVSSREDGYGSQVGTHRGNLLSCKPREILEVKKTIGYDCKPLCEDPCKPKCPEPCKPVCEDPCAPKCPDPCEDPCDPCAPKGCGNWIWFLVWFFVIAIIVYFIVYALKPEFAQYKNERGEPNGEIDPGKVLFTAIIVAIVIIIIAWIFLWACGGRYGRY